MPKLPTSLTEISTEYPVFAAGTYPARIVASELGASKKSGAPMVTLTFECRNEETGEKVTVWEYYVLTKDGKPNEGSLRALKRIVVALFGEDSANDPDFDTDNLKDQDCQVVLKQVEEEDQGGEQQLRNRVQRVMAA